MNRAPAFQFYVNDWMRDMLEHPLEVRGAWITMLCKLWWSETPGTLGRNLSQWARILGVDDAMARSVIDYVKIENIADVTESNGKITITSRRMLRDYIERKNNAIRQRRFREKHESDTECNAKVTPVSSSSSSSSNTYMQHFDEFWEIYPMRNGRKLGKKICMGWWKKNGADHEQILMAVQNYTVSNEVKCGYAKDPIRFLKADYWRDWLNEEKFDPCPEIPLITGKKEYWEDG